jgi:hypothetical protein
MLSGTKVKVPSSGAVRIEPTTEDYEVGADLLMRPTRFDPNLTLPMSSEVGFVR